MLTQNLFQFVDLCQSHNPFHSCACCNAGGTGEFVCEPDEYARFVVELKQSGLIKDHRSGLRLHKRSFMGKDFVNWVIKTKGLGLLHASKSSYAMVLGAKLCLSETTSSYVLNITQNFIYGYEYT